MLRSIATTPPTPITEADRTGRHRELLDAQIELGHVLTELAVAQAKSGTLSVPVASKSFDEVTRGVRRAMLMSRKFAEPIRSVDRVAARKQIARKVEDNIQCHAEDEDQARDLHGELLDRLDSLDLEEEIGRRPLEDIITDIIRDLGLAHVPGNHPWKRRTPEDLAELQTLAEKQVKDVEGTTILSQGPGTASLAFLPQTTSIKATHRR